jgi:DNA repair photolyase
LLREGAAEGGGGEWGCVMDPTLSRSELAMSRRIYDFSYIERIIQSYGDCLTKRKMTTIIYEPRGRAKEYSELAANLYSGCDHACSYCYAPLATRKKRDTFCLSKPRDGVLKKFLNDAEELERQNEKRSILLSFTTDPYQSLDVKYQLTREAIKILHNHNLCVSILTKGGKRSERDFDLLSKNKNRSEYGITLVFIDEEMRQKMEPGAAPVVERIEALKKAHKLGIKTYVSLEPVWFPEDALKFIDMTHDFVDLFKVGKLNYNPQQFNVNWTVFRNDVIEKLREYGVDYYIKKDLEKYSLDPLAVNY